MAVILPDKLYVGGAYLDANISVADITELSQKALSDDFFLGMEVKMPEAFFAYKVFFRRACRRKNNI